MKTTELKNVFVRRVVEIRKKKGMSAAGLARALGVTPQTVCDYEKGRKCPSLNQLQRFAAALGVSPEKLLK